MTTPERRDAPTSTSDLGAALSAQPIGTRLVAATEMGLDPSRRAGLQAIVGQALPLEAIDASVGESATRAAELVASRLEASPAATLGAFFPEHLRFAIFLGLARANAPVERRWEVLFPYDAGAKLSLVIECLGALPPKRRAAAVMAAAQRVHPAWAESYLLALLPTVPEAPVLKLLRRYAGSDRPKHAVERSLLALAAAHPPIAALLALDPKQVGRPPKPPAKLVFTKVPTPHAHALTALARKQLGPRLEKADANDLDELLARVDLFEVRDEAGRHVYDVVLWLGDDGPVYRAGTTRRIASFSQGGVDEASASAKLVAALSLGFHDWHRDRA